MEGRRASIAKQKMIEKSIASRETRSILKEIPRCEHGHFERICPKCIVAKSTFKDQI